MQTDPFFASEKTKESGYDQLEAFRKLMQQMDIKRDEMQVIFNVLDSWLLLVRLLRTSKPYHK